MHNPIQSISIGSFEALALTCNTAKAVIVPAFGCNIIQLILNAHNILDGNTTESDLKANVLAKGNFLIPFPNRIENGTYTFEGKKYQLPCNHQPENHAIHGLLWDKPFTITEQNIADDSVSIKAEHTIEPDQYTGYPFHLHSIITITLSTKKLTIEISAKNNGNQNLPYGAGWHPYITTGKTIDDCTLNIPSNHIMELSDTSVMIPTGKIIETTVPKGEKLETTTFDTCFTPLISHETIFENIHLFQDKTMNFLQIYTPEQRTSIAIEPMSCAPNAFNNGMGLISLAPHQSVMHTFGIFID